MEEEKEKEHIAVEEEPGRSLWLCKHFAIGKQQRTCLIHRDPGASHSIPHDLQEEMQIAIEEQHGANPLYTYANVSCGGATTADFDFQMDYLPKVGWVRSVNTLGRPFHG